MNQFPELKSPNSEIVLANYNKLSEHIRRLTPQGIQCSVFCGGINCKYENPDNWKPESLAIQGIFSHWITDNVLAMARPSTILIVRKNVIQQFESLGIRSIINLQSPREHASCGQPLEQSGFSYDPNIFMENNIFYYNFAWKDYGDATILGLLNMVKVLAFAVSEGRVAVHCHAGLGRTGVLIACYLVYALRVSANDAIRYVRLKRPGSVQTRGQIICVRHFAQFIHPQKVIYFLKDLVSKDKYMNDFTLNKFLRRQKVVLHGYDERNYKYIPKIIHFICERILKLCGCWVDEFPPSNIPYTVDFLCAKMNAGMQRHESTYSLSSANLDGVFSPNDLMQSPSEEVSGSVSPNPSENGDPSDSISELSTLDGEEISVELLVENKCFQVLENQKMFAQEQTDESSVIHDTNTAIDALLGDFASLDTDTKKKVRQYQFEINTSQLGWIKLRVENDLKILATLLFEWIEQLKVPILRRDNLESIVIFYKKADICLQKFAIEDGYCLEYILRFITKLNPISKENQNDLLKRFAGSLTKQMVVINDRYVPSGKGFSRFREGTFNCTMEFFRSLLEMVENHHSQKTTIYFNENEKISDESDVETSFH